MAMAQWDVPSDREVLRSRQGNCWVADDGIVRVSIDPGAEQDLADAREAVSAAAKLDDRPLPWLIDYRYLRSVSRDAREYYAGEETQKHCAAAALLVGSALSRVIANFFIGLNRPVTPTRLFTDEQQALQWLREVCQRK